MNPRLDVRHLQMVIALEETGSVAEAASLLGITASALSHRIREAERRLGVLFVERVGRGLRLTPGAELLATSGKRLLGEMERVEATVTGLGKGVEHVVRLGIGGYSSYHWLPAFLTEFYRDFPGIDVEMVAGAVQRPLAALRDGEIDVALVADASLPPGVKAIPLFEDELVLILSPRHALCARDYIEAEDLAEEVVLTYSFTALPGHERERLWLPAKISPTRLKRVELVEAIVELVKAGFGVSILTRWAMQPHIEWGALVAKQLTKQGLGIGWSAVVRNTDGPQSPAQALASALAAWCAKGSRGFNP